MPARFFSGRANMFTFKTDLKATGQKVTGLVIEPRDLARLLAGMGCMIELNGELVVVFHAADEAQARRYIAHAKGPFSDQDAALARVGLWSCGHEAGHAC